MNKVRIGEVATLRPKLPLGAGENASAPVAFTAMADIGEDGRVQNIQERKLEEVKKGFTYFSKGDVLLAKITPCMENGKAAYINELPHDHGFGSTEFHVNRPGDQIDGKYLFYAIWNAEFRAIAKNNMKGAVGQKRLPASYIEDHEVSLPPLPEQKRIAAILDKADAIRRKRQETLTLTESLIQSTFLDMFGDPVTNPKKWPIELLGKLADNRDGEREPIKAADRAKRSGPYPYYGASGVIDNFDDYLFDEPALLIGEDGANLLARSTPIAFIATGKYWVNNHAHVLTENGKALLEYLQTAINMLRLNKYVSGSAQPKLNQSNLNRIPLPLPSMEFQMKFSVILNKIKSLQSKELEDMKESDNLLTPSSNAHSGVN